MTTVKSNREGRQAMKTTVGLLVLACAGLLLLPGQSLAAEDEDRFQQIALTFDRAYGGVNCSNARAKTYDLSTVSGRQQALKELGYYQAAVDGVWGPYSKGALTQFQYDKGLAADGVWGPITEAAMIAALNDW